MPTLLHLDAGAHTSEESLSRTLTAEFARAWRADHPGAAYDYRDLERHPIAPITSAYCALGRRVQHLGADAAAIPDAVRSADERAQWARTAPLIDQLARADVLLLGAPMYNLGVPAALKAWIDRVTFPAALRDADGRSLLRELDVVVVSPRGGAYGEAAGYAQLDFVGPYLRAWLTRYGANDERIHVVSADHTLAGLLESQAERRPAASRSLADARFELARLARFTRDTRHRQPDDHQSRGSLVG